MKITNHFLTPLLIVVVQAALCWSTVAGTVDPTTDDTRGCAITSLLSNPPLNLAIAIDISQSTYRELFDGTPVGDVNGDGKAETILDAEIQAVLDLLDVILEDPVLNNDVVDIGFIPFETEGHYKGEYLPNGHYPPLNAAGTAVNPELVEHLKAIRTSKDSNELVYTNFGFTNFDDALDKAIDYYIDRGDEILDRHNVLVFLSDGVPTVRGDGDNEEWCANSYKDCGPAPADLPDASGTSQWNTGELAFCTSGDTGCRSHEYSSCARGRGFCANTPGVQTFTSELAKLDEMEVIRISIGVGGGSDTSEGSALDMIDSNTDVGILPKQVMTTDDLREALQTLCVEGTEPPTMAPTTEPPTKSPTTSPTASPTVGESGSPTKAPVTTASPTTSPTASPTKSPTTAPSLAPTESPTISCDGGFLLTKYPLNIGVVLDVSHSTYRDDFSGTTVGDVNNDGKEDSILDAEIQAVLDLLTVIQDDPDLNNDNVDIGVIIFDTEAQYKGQYVSQGHYPPLDSNGNVNPTLVNHLKSIKTSTSMDELNEKNWGSTNFDDALDKAIDYFEDPEVDTDRTNVMLFISDGTPNVRGDGDDEPWCSNAGDHCYDGNAPANLPDTSDTDPWETGAISFCTRLDPNCAKHPYQDCVRGSTTCQDTPSVSMYDSELQRLDDFDVYRVTIGVGGGSETDVGSALYKIDNNIMKGGQGYVPPQYFTTDALSQAVTHLCVPPRPPSTRAPTTSPTTLAPTAAPTKAPTTSTPTSAPTKSPTTSTPTAAPTKAPTTSAPTAAPTKAPTTSTPTAAPTKAPTTSAPTAAPTKAPTTSAPTTVPPSMSPTTVAPTKAPTKAPTTSAPTTAAPIGLAPPSETSEPTSAPVDPTITTKSGGGFGDPHFKTWQGHQFDFHGACDLVLVHSSNFASGLGLDIQVRTEVREFYSFIKSTAIRIGKDILEVSSYGVYSVNGVKDVRKSASLLAKLEHFKIWYSGKPNGKRHTFTLDLHDQGLIEIKVYDEFVSVTVLNGKEEYFSDSVGIMGAFSTGQMLTRDGTSDLSTKPVEFGREWQVRGTTEEPNYFQTTEGPQYPTFCTMPDPEELARRQRRLRGNAKTKGPNDISLEDARKACANWSDDSRDSCIYDILATGVLALAENGAF